MVGHNASRFDNYIVLNSLPSSYNFLKILQTSRGLTKVSFKAGSVIENNVQIPKFLNLVCSICRISGSLKNILTEYNMQPHLIGREMDHDCHWYL